MKKHLITFFDKIILFLLGFSGIFYGCMKYGMPSANFEINGVVTNKETSRPIKHIQITLPTMYGEKNDTLYTNSRGEYNLKFYTNVEFNSTEHHFHLKLEDIDSEENGGEFENKEIDVVFTDKNRIKRGKGRYDLGTFAKTQNIDLETKK